MASSNVGYSPNVPLQQGSPNQHPFYQNITDQILSKYHRSNYDPVTPNPTAEFSHQYHAQSFNLQTSPQNDPYPHHTLAFIPQDSFISPPAYIKQEPHQSQFYPTFSQQEDEYYGRGSPLLTRIKQEYLPYQQIYQDPRENPTSYSSNQHIYNPIPRATFRGNTQFSHIVPYQTITTSHFDSTSEYESSPQNEKVTKTKLNNEHGWIEDSPNLPSGWKMKKNKGNANELYKAPNGTVFNSRSEAFKFMQKELIGDSSPCKTSSLEGQIERRKTDKFPKTKFYVINKLSGQIKKSSSKASGRRRSERNPYEEESDNFVNSRIYSDWSCDDDTLPAGWKKRSYKEPNSRYTKFEFLSPDQNLFLTRSSVAAYMRATRGYTKEEITRVFSGNKPSSSHSQMMMAKNNSIKQEYGYDHSENLYLNEPLNVNGYFNTNEFINEHFNFNQYPNLKEPYNINEHFNINQHPNLKEKYNVSEELIREQFKRTRDQFNINEHFNINSTNEKTNEDDQSNSYGPFNPNNINEAFNDNDIFNKNQHVNTFDKVDNEITKSYQQVKINDNQNKDYEPIQYVTNVAQFSVDGGEQLEYQANNRTSQMAEQLESNKDNDDLEIAGSGGQQFSDWILDTTLPEGWKVRSKEMEDESMQTQYLSPDGKFLKSLKEAIKYIGTLKKYKEDLKSELINIDRKEQEESKPADDGFAFSRWEQDGTTLPKGWKRRIGIHQTQGQEFQYLTHNNQVLKSIKEIFGFLKNSDAYDLDETIEFITKIKNQEDLKKQMREK